jgi:hypothetical protein
MRKPLMAQSRVEVTGHVPISIGRLISEQSVSASLNEVRRRSAMIKTPDSRSENIMSDTTLSNHEANGCKGREHQRQRSS